MSPSLSTHVVRLRLAAWLLALLLPGLMGLSAPPVMAQTQQAPVADLAATPTTKITPGCVLGVTVTDESQLTGAFPVDADGNIHFTLTDPDGLAKTEWAVNVKDKMVEEARTVITESLKTYLRFPEVSVVIASIPRLRVTISGPARVTGRLELPPNAHFTDAMIACKYLPEADLANIRILRPEALGGKTPPKDRTIPVDFSAFLRGENNNDPPLQSGDKIIIPTKPEPPAALKLVRIVGEVSREASIPLAPGMTVHDAFNRAGGLTETADREHVRLVRGADGHILELDADKVEANDPVYNLPVGAGDLIIVGQKDRGRRYAVLGEVMEQKTLEWDEKMKVTLLSALEQAGGPNKNADPHRGVLRRGYLLDPSQSRDLPFDLEAVLKGKQQNYQIEPGDAIFLLPKEHRPSIFQQLLPVFLHFLPFGL
jgi:protein involved in polysaccharide export with SLBB domain